MEAIDCAHEFRIGGLHRLELPGTIAAFISDWRLNPTSPVGCQSESANDQNKVDDMA
jgi:hypothetical protein